MIFTSVLGAWGVQDIPDHVPGELLAVNETVFAPERHQMRVMVGVLDNKFQLVDEHLELDEVKRLTRLIVVHAVGTVASEIDDDGQEFMLYTPTAAIARFVERDFFSDEVDTERSITAQELPVFSCMVRRAAQNDALGDGARSWDDHTVWDFSRCAPTLNQSTRQIEWTKSITLNQRK